MNSLKSLLSEKLGDALYNNLGKENHDELRFGAFVAPDKMSLIDTFKYTVKKYTGFKKKFIVESYLNWYKDYFNGLEILFESLPQQDKLLLVDLLAFRLLGSTKIKLPTNNPSYWNAIEQAKKLKDKNDKVDPNFKNFILEKFTLDSIGYDAKLYFTDIGVVIDFIIEQYAYKNKGEVKIAAEKGDVVLDVGGCWGDTAIYFANKVGADGKVYSFEFIPNNIALFKTNVAFNPKLENIINLVPHPVSEKSDINIFFKDNGPGSQINFDPFPEQTGQTTTLSIDDFVERYKVEKVDFIKMDIEGAEPYALKGAINTIRKFKPKLAIAIYHSMEDFVNIPKWILDLNLGYEINIGHYTIHEEETVVFAKAKNK